MYDMNKMNENFDAFDEYVMKFDMNEDKIKYKYNHSYRVMHLCDDIAFTLKLEEDDTYLANIIGLLHDFGRFEQWTKYKTFSDFDSVDHGKLGAKLLFEDGLIKNFGLEEKDYELVKTAIIVHNLKDIPDDITDERTLMFCKIIRDADKLDILYAFSNPRILELEEEEGGITKEVIDEFEKHEIVNKKICKNLNDRIFIFLAFVFDLNYEYTWKTILEKKYLESMLNHLKNKKMFKPYFEEAIKYLKEKK